MVAVARKFPVDALTRICPRCHVEKPKDAYSKNVWNRTSRSGFHCRDCKAAEARNYKYLARYGITTDDYEVMLKQQNGCCAFCHEPPNPKKRLSVDHDHGTNRVRGLLCDKCNWAFGLLGDTEESLLRAYEYTKVS